LSPKNNSNNEEKQNVLVAKTKVSNEAFCKMPMQICYLLMASTAHIQVGRWTVHETGPVGGGGEGGSCSPSEFLESLCP